MAPYLKIILYFYNNKENVMSTPMSLGTLGQFWALNIFRKVAIAKHPLVAKVASFPNMVFSTYFYNDKENVMSTPMLLGTLVQSGP